MTRCPVCNRWTRATSHEYLNTGPHAHRIFEARTLVTCQRCDSVWCPRPPSSQELGEYYATSYRPARMRQVEEDVWPIWDTRATSLIMLARLFTEWQPQDLFVDVGPGNGAALSLAPLMLRNPRLGCVELNEESIVFLRRHAHQLEVATRLDHFEEGTARIVYSAHSLEHFRPSDAVAELQAIRRMLVPGGVLTLEVPHAPSARAHGQSRHSPHLIFFSQDGLRRILERAGFEVPLVTTVMGRRASDAVARRQPPPKGTSPSWKQRLLALNTGDLTGVSRGLRPGRAVLKVVARRPFGSGGAP